MRSQKRSQVRKQVQDSSVSSPTRESPPLISTYMSPRVMGVHCLQLALWGLAFLGVNRGRNRCAQALSDRLPSNRRKSPALWRLLEYHDQQQTSRTAIDILKTGEHQKHKRVPVKPEIMAPAGGFPQLKAAVANGADAVYVGLAAFSARARATNFDADELVRAVEYCHSHDVHLYVALNTLIFDVEWAELRYWIQACQRAGVDALIVQDVGLARLIATIAPDIALHASTQQSITDADGVQFAAQYQGATRVVLGRELSVSEMRHIQEDLSSRQDRDRTSSPPPPVELEVFCHGALCVSYSGQCFSSEAWGGRSANRGQCAQACRLPYGLIVNGELQSSNQDMSYVLSPQDLSGVELVPQLIQAGVACLKIEGRLKDAAYVAATTRAYRQAVDDAWDAMGLADATTSLRRRVLPHADERVARNDLVQLFARGQDAVHDGLTTGFLEGTQHQKVVRGRSPRHRGVHVGRVVQSPHQKGGNHVRPSDTTNGVLWVQLDDASPGDNAETFSMIQLKLGDGLVVDRGRPQEEELGGPIYGLRDMGNGLVRIEFGREVARRWQQFEQLEQELLAPTGAHVWRTANVDVTKKYRKLAEAAPIKTQAQVRVQVQGRLGDALKIQFSDDQGRCIVVYGDEPLQAAQGKGLTKEQIRKAIGSLGNTQITLDGEVSVDMEGLWCPISQIKKVRRLAVDEWQACYGMEKAPLLNHGQNASKTVPSTTESIQSVLDSLLPGVTTPKDEEVPLRPRLSVLCRTLEQVEAICEAIGLSNNSLVSEIMIDFLELEGMKEAMDMIRNTPVRAVVASPRVLKPEEGGIWKSLLALRPDALLVRSTGLLYRMQQIGGQGASVDVGVANETNLVEVPELLGDFSLNVANALTASELLKTGLSRVTASYDLNARSIRNMSELLKDASSRLEVVAHCHMPIFHTEHCVFARFLSKGNSYLDCGHACTRNNVHLRDEMTGQDNLVLADMGCRNTVFAAQAQAGVHSLLEWNRAGINHFRIELVDEDNVNAKTILSTYEDVIGGHLRAKEAFDRLAFIRDSNGRAAGVSLGSFRNTQERRAGEVKPNKGLSRRDAIASATSLLFLGNHPQQASASLNDESFGASWRAVEGLNSANSNFVSFDKSAYRAMRDDPTRTPLFEKAIEERLGNTPETQTVLDLGTGPFALFAILAAEKGAGKVYAIEADPDAARSAREFVKKSGWKDVITIVEGYSTQVDLPEKVDFVVAEIVGSIASEEGAYATIRDAHRFVKEPNRNDSWIPSRIQTYAAPASYTLHNLFGPPEFDWSKLGGEPVRFNCRDKGLELLSDPALIEDISFAQIFSKEQSQRNAKKELVFTVDPERLEQNTLAFFDEFRRDGRTNVRDAEILAFQTGHSFTGIACWPRLILSDNLVVDSRQYKTGDHQRSHWQTVLPIMCSRPIAELKGSEKVRVAIDFTLPEDVRISPRYKMEGVFE